MPSDNEILPEDQSEKAGGLFAHPVWKLANSPFVIFVLSVVLVGGFWTYHRSLTELREARAMRVLDAEIDAMSKFSEVRYRMDEMSAILSAASDDPIQKIINANALMFDSPERNNEVRGLDSDFDRKSTAALIEDALQSINLCHGILKATFGNQKAAKSMDKSGLINHREYLEAMQEIADEMRVSARDLNSFADQAPNLKEQLVALQQELAVAN